MEKKKLRLSDLVDTNDKNYDLAESVVKGGGNEEIKISDATKYAGNNAYVGSRVVRYIGEKKQLKEDNKEREL